MAKVNREEIIDAAVRLFNQNGYHATSMQDIARAVSIKKPSLYHHFESKEAILLEVLEESMNHLISEMEAVVASDGNCTTKLCKAIEVHAGTIAASPQRAAVFLREDRGLGDQYLEVYLAKRDRFEDQVRTIIRQGIAEGTFRETDVTITAHAIFGMVNWMTRWYRTEGRLSAQEISAMFVDLILKGLLDQGARS